MARIAEHFGGKPPAAGPADDVRPAAAAPAASAVHPAAPEPMRAAAPRPAPVHEAAAVAAPAPHPAEEPGRKRPPVLTDVAVLVAGLQDSTRIWSELPPEEYFELINHIWSTVDPIFRRHAGTHGKHPADGMVCYFFPLPAGSYLWNALAAAQELKEAMRRVSKEWQLRKGWTTELYMNVGIDEGREWLGSFRSGGADFTALAGTIKHAARISDFSRHGAVWATKNLVGKLSREDRQRLKYGVRRKNSEGRHVFVSSVFSSVQRLAGQGGGERPKEIALLAVTEIVEVPADKGRQPPHGPTTESI
jgi:class 3 adenylate cyclase